jgi:MarR family transcriptional regulator, lower aerobic nicotinate degradation pathway regulator
MPTIAKSSRKPQLLKSKPVNPPVAPKSVKPVTASANASTKAVAKAPDTKVAAPKAIVHKSAVHKSDITTAVATKPAEARVLAARAVTAPSGGTKVAMPKTSSKVATKVSAKVAEKPAKSVGKTAEPKGDEATAVERASGITVSAPAAQVADKSIATPKASIDRTSAFKAAAVKAAAAKAAAAKPTAGAAGLAAAEGGYVLEDQIGFHLRRAHQRATSIFHDVMAQFDVTPTQFAALAKIDELGAVSQTFLGRLTGMDAATILGVVGRLLRQGLIIARAEPGDMRMTVLELSPKGRMSIDSMKAMALSVSAKTVEPLTPAEATTLSELLAKIM